MEQLLEITRVPIEIEMKTSRAQLEYTRGTAELEVSRDKGGLSIKSRAIQLNIDTFEMRSSIVPTPTQAIEQGADKGKQAAYKATASFAQEGELYLKAQIGEDVQAQLSQTAISTQMFSQPGLDFIPKAAPEITWDPGEMNIRYEMDKLNFDWRVNKTKFEFIPGDIEISVKQKPEVIIKYVGGPLYVPPSADPDYEPVDVQA
ncbi:MAG: hypothetical protein HFF90_12550 [Oscillibacter sp.]|nr:hypothetical protein [Oscillibacter sp.]